MDAQKQKEAVEAVEAVEAGKVEKVGSVDKGEKEEAVAAAAGVCSGPCTAPPSCPPHARGVAEQRNVSFSSYADLDKGAVVVTPAGAGQRQGQVQTEEAVVELVSP